jgi:hypothetical protein
MVVPLVDYREHIKAVLIVSADKIKQCITVTSQDFIKFWGKFFSFILPVLIENSQGFETFEFI